MYEPNSLSLGIQKSYNYHMNLSSVEKTDLLLLLLYSKGQSGKINEPIVGITRLMKLLFLLKKEQDFNQFEFEAYKMGPFSSDVYPELEFLQNFPTPETPFVLSKNHIDPQALATPENIRIIEEASEQESTLTSDEINKPFALSELGIKVAEELWQEAGRDNQIKIEKIKSQFGALTLKELLRYVYKTYPDMTVNSEIKDQI